MAYPRFYCQAITTNKVDLIGSEAHHLAQVMRLGAGDVVELFDGKGITAIAQIEAIKKKNILLNITETRTDAPRINGRIILVVSMAKGDRFDWMISKCTELGVDRICPALFQRTVKQGKGAGLTERYNNLAIASAKQCRRNFLPVIDEPMPLDKIIDTVLREYPSATLMTASLAENPISIFDPQIINSCSDKIVFVGPEGGLSDQEEAYLGSKGSLPVRLTSTILRIETAGIAMCSVLAIARDTQTADA